MVHHLSVKRANNFLQKTRGLIGKKRFEPLYFETRWGIHTFLMQVPIDVLVLDRNSQVVNIRENLPPGRIYFWNPKYKKVLELPVGYISGKNIREGDEIILS